MAIYLVRHGESTGNFQDLFSCREEHPLTDTGIEQATLLGRWLAGRGVRFKAVFSSPLQRAHDTASLISTAVAGPDPIIDSRLTEYDCGEADGMPAAEVRKRWPGFFSRPLDKWADHLPFGGETYEDVSTRTSSFRREIESHYDFEDNLLVVAHGGSLPHLLVQWCAWPQPRLMHIRMANCCCLKIQLRSVVDQIIGNLIWSVSPELISDGKDISI